MTDGQHVATLLDTQAWKLNPGDQILLSNGQTSKVQRVRQHETSPSTHVYIDTENGTTVARRDSNVRLSPGNTRQQVIPGYGTPGGNTDRQPMMNHMPGVGGGAAGRSSEGGSPKCPRDGMTMVRRGASFVCPHCGNTVSQHTMSRSSPSSGRGRQTPMAFTDAPRVLNPRVSSKKKKTAAQVADKENTRMTDSTQNRSDLVNKLASAANAAERQQAAAALDHFDQTRRQQIQASRDLDFAHTAVSTTLQPRVSHQQQGTMESDWLDGAYRGVSITAARSELIAEAGMWFERCDDVVKAHPDEFAIQAQGYIERQASRFGEHADGLTQEALQYVGFLWRQAASGLPQIQQTVDSHDNPSTTPLPVDVFDNFAPPVDPINEGVVGTETSERAPQLQELEANNGQGAAEWPSQHSLGNDPQVQARDQQMDASSGPTQGNDADLFSTASLGGMTEPVYTPTVANNHTSTLADVWARMDREAASQLPQVQQTVDGEERPAPTPLPVDVAFPWEISPNQSNNGADGQSQGEEESDEDDDEHHREGSRKQAYDFNDYRGDSWDPSSARQFAEPGHEHADHTDLRNSYRSGYDWARGSDQESGPVNPSEVSHVRAYALGMEHGRKDGLIGQGSHSGSSKSASSHDGDDDGENYSNHYLHGYYNGHEEELLNDTLGTASRNPYREGTDSHAGWLHGRRDARQGYDHRLPDPNWDEPEEDIHGDDDPSSRMATYKYVKPNPDGDGYVVTQKGTGKVLSHHDTKSDAEASFRAMMQSKHGSVQRQANLHSMEDGDNRDYVIGGQPFKVEYRSEQAYGDNGAPARGFTTGHYYVTGPSGREVSFRHTPNGPGLDRAKAAAAEDAMQHMRNQARQMNRKGSVRRQADMYGNSDMPHPVALPNVAESGDLIPVPANSASYERGVRDAQDPSQRPDYMDNSSAIPQQVADYSRGYSDGSQERPDELVKNEPRSMGADEPILDATVRGKVSSRFTDSATASHPDFRKGYRFASKWHPGSPLVALGSPEFEAGLYAAMADRPEAREMWRAAHRRQGSRKLATRMSDNDAYTDYLQATAGIDVTAASYQEEGTYDPGREREIMERIQARDPDSGEGMADHDAHHQWAVKTYGPRAWKTYIDGNWAGGDHYATKRQAGTSTDLDTMSNDASPSPTGQTPINGPGTVPPLAGGDNPAAPGGPSPYNGVPPYGQGVVPNNTQLRMPSSNAPLIEDMPGGPVDQNVNLDQTKLSAFRRTVQASLLKNNLTQGA